MDYAFPCGCSFPIIEEDPPPGVVPLLDFDLDRLPEDCPAAWELLGRGLTKGVFQLESGLGRQWTRQLKPETVEHLTALGALLRPGCLANLDEEGVSTTKHYCLRKNGEEDVEPYHPAVDPILESTYGQMIFQEQSMAIARAVAGFSLRDADTLRKSIGKKLPEEMAKVKVSFLEGAKKAGVISDGQAEELFGWIEKSQRYSFNKCVSFDTYIRRAGKGRHSDSDHPLTVAEMYRIRRDLAYAKATGHEELRKKWKRLGNYGKGLSLCEDGRIRPNLIVDIQPAGFRPVYRVVLADGRSVRATDNHKFPTAAGDFTVAEIASMVASGRPPSLFVCGEYEPTDYRKVGGFSDVTREAQRERGKGKAVAGCFGEANVSYTNGSCAEFKKNGALVPMVCSACGREDGRLELDHKSRDRSDSSPENLQRLCSSCHKKKEYAAGRVRRGQKGYPSLEVGVVSVEPDGECETYDVTMDAPDHNFVLGGSDVVTCNSHACAYAWTGYECAYVKAHFPLAFFASWLRHARLKNSGGGPRQERQELVNDARLFDVEVLAPDFRTLEPLVYTDRRSVRFGLADVKGVGEAQVKKIAEAAREVEAELGIPVAEWSWWQFLLHAAPRMAPSAVDRLVEAGAFDWSGLPRRRMLAERQAVGSLTEGELRWVREHAPSGPAMEALAALGRPRYQKPKVAPRAPRDDSDETRAALADCELRRLELELRLAGAEESGDFLARADLLGGLKSVRRAYCKLTVPAADPGPDPAVNGGCNDERRRRAALSAALLLESPPSPLVDTPQWLAYLEEELMGISLTCSKVDGCDVSEVNCSCRDFLAGRSGFIMLGVEVKSAREVRTKRGKSPGSKMAYLTLADHSCQLEAVCFPDTWKELSAVLAEGALVAVRGERDQKRKDDTLIIKKAWPLGRATNKENA